MASILNNAGLFKVPSFKIGDDDKAKALLSVTISGIEDAVNSTNDKTDVTEVIVVSCDGGLQINHQNLQDFEGNNYLTVFGKSVNDFSLKCAEATDCKRNPKQTLATIANKIKNATSVGKVPVVTIVYNGMTIKGALIGITFDLDLPYQSYTLHVIGTQQ